MMPVETSRLTLLVLFVLINCLVQGENILNRTSTLPPGEKVTTTETSTTTTIACPGGHINPPECTNCSANFKVQNGQCVATQNENKPSRSTGRRIALIFFACLLTVVLLVTLLSIYVRLNRQRRRGPSSNLENMTGSPNGNNRWNNLLRTIGLNQFNKRGRFNFFSISNNDSALGTYRQPDNSRSHLNENLDEALLFDDPYADGGFHQSSANPYRTLTLAVT